MNIRPCVTVIIVTYESRDFITTCLDSLLEHSRPWLHEIRVIENCSSDDIETVLAGQSSLVKFSRTESNIGFGKAVNRAAAGVTSDYLLILNPDTVTQPGMVGELVHFLDHRAKAGACGPFITTAAGVVDRSARRGFPTPLSALGYATRLDRLFPNWKLIGQYHRRWLPVDYEVTTDSISGCCMMIRRPVFEQVGGFDPDYFLFGEDIDLCWKLNELGWERWYVPCAKLVHIKHASMSFASDRAKAEFFRAMEIFAEKRLASHYSKFTLFVIKFGIRLWSKLTGRW